MGLVSDLPDDPVLKRRAVIARWVAIAKRVGYGALVVGIIVFFIGLATGFPAWTVTGTILALVIAFGVLPLPIVLGYGVRAAEREDQGP
jgi:hypothetical protein